MAQTIVSNEEYQRAKEIALRCAKNIVEDLSLPEGRITGTDIEDVLGSGKELVHALAIVRKWQRE